MTIKYRIRSRRRLTAAMVKRAALNKTKHRREHDLAKAMNFLALYGGHGHYKAHRDGSIRKAFSRSRVFGVDPAKEGGDRTVTIDFNLLEARALALSERGTGKVDPETGKVTDYKLESVDLVRKHKEFAERVFAGVYGRSTKMVETKAVAPAAPPAPTNRPAITP